jgi:hypothetical protein
LYQIADCEEVQLNRPYAFVPVSNEKMGLTYRVLHILSFNTSGMLAALPFSLSARLMSFLSPLPSR